MDNQKYTIGFKNPMHDTSFWNTNNPILLSGQIGIEIISDGVFRIKTGDGKNKWRDLQYIGTDVGQKYIVDGDTLGEIFNDYKNNIAKGMGSHAEGKQTKAGGDYSHTEGSSTATGIFDGEIFIGEGDFAHAEGSGTNAAGEASHSEGTGTQASGASSHSEGRGSQAFNENSHAEGYYTQNWGDNSHTEGYGTYTWGDNSHAEGKGCITSGDQSHAEGQETYSGGPSSHTEGWQTKTGKYDDGGLLIDGTGFCAHAEGASSQAEGIASHAEGYVTRAVGQGSHSEGSNTEANGDYSHAEGLGNKTTLWNQHVQGMYAEIDNEQQYVHIVGWGTDDLNRKNIHTIDWSGGNAWFAGDVKVGPDRKVLATIDDVKANKTTVDSALSTTSTNPVQNKIVAKALNDRFTKDETIAKINAALGGISSETLEDMQNLIGELEAAGDIPSLIEGKADKNSVYTKEESNSAIAKGKVAEAKQLTPVFDIHDDNQTEEGFVKFAEIVHTGVSAENGCTLHIFQRYASDNYAKHIDAYVTLCASPSTDTSKSNYYYIHLEQLSGEDITDRLMYVKESDRISFYMWRRNYQHIYATTDNIKGTKLTFFTDAFDTLTTEEKLLAKGGVKATYVAQPLAQKAMADENGNNIVNTYATKDELSNVGSTYELPAAGTSLGGVKSGGGVTISNGEITIKDDSHNHVISNVDGLQTALDSKSNTGHIHTEATQTASGFMSAADKAKLDELSERSSDTLMMTGTYTGDNEASQMIDLGKTPKAVLIYADGVRMCEPTYTTYDGSSFWINGYSLYGGLITDKLSAGSSTIQAIPLGYIEENGFFVTNGSYSSGYVYGNMTGTTYSYIAWF